MQNCLKIAQLTDSNLLTEIHSECFEKGWNLAAIEDYMRQPNCYALLAGNLGFILFQIVVDECEIKTICVMPQERGKGYAKLLCAEAIDVISGLSAKKIFLEVAENNISALNLYKKLGFEVYGKREKYYANGDAAILLHLIIAI